MQSRTSLGNKQLFILIGRNTGWLGIAYFIGLLFALPLNVWMQLSNEEYHYYLTYGHMFQLNFVLQAGLMMVIPVLLSVFLFRYLHVKQQADMIHSLPVKREKLFYHFSIAGFLMLVIPVIITALLMTVITLSNDLGPHFQPQDILEWTLITLLMDILFFVVGITLGMLTGLSVIQALLTYIALLFPAGIYVLVVLNLKNFLFGFPQEYFFNVQPESFSPILKAGMFHNVSLSAVEVVLYAGLSILLYVLSIVLYKKRKLETASQAISVPLMKPVFKFGIILCLMLLSGAYFSEVQSKLSWTLFGYGSGFIIGYLISEMILQKTWRVSPRWKELAGFAVFISLIIFTFQLGFNNYEKAIPDMDEISKVHFSDNVYSYLDSYGEEPVRYLEQKENIENVRKLHEEIVSEKPKRDGMDQAFIVYELKDGSKVIREYDIKRSEYKSYYAAIYESVEYKQAIEPILSVDIEMADKISITARGPHNKQMSLTDESLLKEALEVLKQEVKEESYESMVDRRDTLYDIEVLLSDDRRIYTSWKPAYTNFKRWLETKGLFEKVKVTANDVSRVVVFKREDHQEASGPAVDFQRSVAELEQKGKTMTIESDEKIEELLESTSWSMESEYMIAFYFKGQDYPDIKGFTEETIPQYITEGFTR
ncbi:DUF6449 domain-containing protein [Bacillus sp. AK031]